MTTAELAEPIIANVLRSCRDWRTTTRAMAAFEKQLSAASAEGGKAVLQLVIKRLTDHRAQFEAPKETRVAE